MNRTIWIFLALHTSCVPWHLEAQVRTLRDKVRTNLAPVTQTSTAYIPHISTADLVGKSDLIVKGIVTGHTSYLSDDESDVLTDLSLANVEVIFPPDASRTSRPGPPPTYTVTQFGGVITLEGHRVSSRHTNLSIVPVGTEGVFLLSRRGDKLFLVEKYLGAFAIRDGRVEPLVDSYDSVAQHKGKSAAAFVAEIVKLRQDR